MTSNVDRPTAVASALEALQTHTFEPTFEEQLNSAADSILRHEHTQRNRIRREGKFSVPPAILESGMGCVIADKPPVDGELTLEEQAAARLARFNLKQAKENKRCHDKNARAAKLKASSGASSKDNALIAHNHMQIHVAEAMHLSLRLSAVFEHLLEAELASCSPPELVQTMSRATIQTVHDVDRMATLLNDRLG